MVVGNQPQGWQRPARAQQKARRHHLKRHLPPPQLSASHTSNSDTVRDCAVHLTEHELLRLRVYHQILSLRPDHGGYKKEVYVWPAGMYKVSDGVHDIFLIQWFLHPAQAALMNSQARQNGVLEEWDCEP